VLAAGLLLGLGARRRQPASDLHQLRQLAVLRRLVLAARLRATRSALGPGVGAPEQCASQSACWSALCWPLCSDQLARRRLSAVAKWGLQERGCRPCLGRCRSQVVQGLGWAELLLCWRDRVYLEGRQVEPCWRAVVVGGRVRAEVLVALHAIKIGGLLCRRQPRASLPDGLLQRQRRRQSRSPCSAFRPVSVALGWWCD